MVDSTATDTPSWFQGTELVSTYQDYEFPPLSIIIPTYNCAPVLEQTIESVIEQDYPNFELIIIDAGSTDHTLEVVKGFQNEKVMIYSVSGFQRYEMLNKGIAQSNGEYLNILFPGDFYISRKTLKCIMSVALDHDKPEMIYCGTLLRESRREYKSLFRPLTASLMKEGHQPTSLQACWFRQDMFDHIGKFDTSYTLRGGFELLCRVINHPNLRTTASPYVLIDVELGVITRESVVLHFYETGRAVWSHFGASNWLLWLFKQKDIKRLYQLWIRSVKQAFMGS